MTRLPTCARWLSYESMIRAVAKQAEAEGELQASEKLVQAAARLSKNPASFQLRYLQTLTEIVGEKNSTVVFPLPMDLIKPLLAMAEKQQE